MDRLRMRPEESQNFLSGFPGLAIRMVGDAQMITKIMFMQTEPVLLPPV